MPFHERETQQRRDAAQRDDWSWRFVKLAAVIILPLVACGWIVRTYHLTSFQVDVALMGVAIVGLSVPRNTHPP